MEQLSGLDGLFVHMEMHRNPMHIASFSIYDPASANNKSAIFEGIQKVFNDSVLDQVPILQCRLLEIPLNLDQPYWVEHKDFDLDYHLRHIALPKPGNWNALMRLLADLHALPLSRSKPLWEAYVIDGLDHIEKMPEGAFALYLKSHHAMMDGRTGIEVFTSLHSLTPTGDAISAESKIDHFADNTMPRFERPGPLKLISRTYFNNIKKSFGMAKLLTNTLPRTIQRISKENKHKEPKPKSAIPRTRFNTLCGPGRVIDRIRVPLSQVQSLRTASTGSTINDVAVTIIAGGMRRYLEHKNECPEQSIVASIPVDIRSKQNSDIKGNLLSIMNIAIRSEITDPLKRLKAVTEESKSAKALSETLGKETIINILQNTYSGIGAWGVKKAITSDFLDQFAPINNTVITNVPGVSFPIYLSGAKMLESFGIGPLMPKTGTFHTISSACDWLSICFTSCKEMMPDPEFYSHCLQAEYNALLDCVNQNGIVIEKPSEELKERNDEGSTDSVAEEIIPPNLAESQSLQAHHH